MMYSPGRAGAPAAWAVGVAFGRNNAASRTVLSATSAQRTFDFMGPPLGNGFGAETSASAGKGQRSKVSVGGRRDGCRDTWSAMAGAPGAALPARRPPGGGASIQVRTLGTLEQGGHADDRQDHKHDPV